MKRSGDIAEKGTSGSTLADLKGEKPWDDEKSCSKNSKDSIYVKHLYEFVFWLYFTFFKSV